MENVVVLAHDEVVRLDASTIRTLTEQMGRAGAEGVVSRAMEEIANRLSLIERCYYQGEKAALWKASRGLVAIADQVGLGSLATCAGHVATCAHEDSDPVALAAVLNRLVRVGDRSLTAAWQMPDMSIS